MKVYFSDFFDVSPELIKNYGAVNITLINDLPLFIDPFLLFGSEKPEYQKLHEEIIEYVAFLRDRSEERELELALINSWFRFPEVKQNWFGYSQVGNGGSGLGQKFASALNENLSTTLSDFGKEETSHSSHLEKLTLIKDGVGKDNISDFTTNLIKKFLLEYTQQFAIANIAPGLRRKVNVPKVYFDYKLRKWMPKIYELPFVKNDFVILTPRDLLTRDEIWINKNDMITDFRDVALSIPNNELRAQLNDYFMRALPARPSSAQYSEAVTALIKRFPKYIDHYIRYKEEHSSTAKSNSSEKVKEVEEIFIKKAGELAEEANSHKEFRESPRDSLEEAYSRLMFLKKIIEDNDGYRFFYVKGVPIKREQDLQLLFKLTWHASDFDVNAEVNNGRGPVDFKISKGSKDSSLVEFKLASNAKLKQNLQHQVKIYEQANQTKKSIKAILYFSDAELNVLNKTLTGLGLVEGKELVLIDARKDKPSASNVQ